MSTRNERMELLMATPAHYWGEPARRVDLPVVNDDGLVDVAALRQELSLRGLRGDAISACVEVAKDEGIIHIPTGLTLWQELDLGKDTPPTPFVAFMPVSKRDWFSSLIHEYVGYWAPREDGDVDGERASRLETICELQDGVFYCEDSEALPLDRQGKPSNRLCPLCYAIYPLGGRWGKKCSEGYSCDLCRAGASHASPRFDDLPQPVSRMRLTRVKKWRDSRLRVYRAEEF